MTQPRWMPSVSHLGAQVWMSICDQKLIRSVMLFRVQMTFSFIVSDRCKCILTHFSLLKDNQSEIGLYNDRWSERVCACAHTRSTSTTDARCFINVLSFQHLTRFHINESEKGKEKKNSLNWLTSILIFRRTIISVSILNFLINQVRLRDCFWSVAIVFKLDRQWRRKRRRRRRRCWEKNESSERRLVDRRIPRSR